MKLLEVSEAEAAALKEQSALISTDSLTRILEVLSDYENRLRDATSKQILVEVALCKAIEARHSVSLDAVLKKLNDLRAGAPSAPAASYAPSPAAAVSAPAPSAPRPTPARAPAPAPVQAIQEAPAAPVAPAATGDSSLDTLWPKLIEAVGRVSQFTRSYLVEAHPVALTKTLFTIGFDPEFADKLALVDNSKNHELIKTKLAELGHHGVQIKFIKAERAVGFAAPVAPAPAAAAPASVAAPAVAPAAATPPRPAPPKAVAAAAPSTRTISRTTRSSRRLWKFSRARSSSPRVIFPSTINSNPPTEL